MNTLCLFSNENQQNTTLSKLWLFLLIYVFVNFTTRDVLSDTNSLLRTFHRRIVTQVLFWLLRSAKECERLVNWWRLVNLMMDPAFLRLIRGHLYKKPDRIYNFETPCHGWLGLTGLSYPSCHQLVAWLSKEIIYFEFYNNDTW